MKKAVVFLVLLLGVAEVLIRLLGSQTIDQPHFSGTVRLAFVSGLSGPGAATGADMRVAAEAAIAAANRAGGIGNLKVELVPFDDHNEPELARTIARQIAADPSIVAVIGHNYSSASLAAGPVYADAGVPAVTPASTNPAVTAGNNWYFSSIYDDRVQGQFMAFYAAQVMKAPQLALITVPSVYADGLAAVIRAESERLGLPLAVDWRGDVAPTAAGDDGVAALTRQLAGVPGDTVVIIAANFKPAVQVVQALRDRGIRLRLLGPDSLGTPQFQRAFADLTRQQLAPGFYTNNVLVSVPFLADTANLEARALLAQVKQQQGSAVITWGAPYAYDAAKLLIEAMRRAGFGPQVPPDARRQVRDRLAQMRTPAQGVPGATGLTWFGDSGAAHKPITIGQFSGPLISSLVQLRQADLDGQLVPVPVVYSGMALRRVERLAANPDQVDVDFDLWFRFAGAVPVDDISFDGALEPIRLGQPTETVVDGEMQYRLYSVHGRFQTDTGGGRAVQSRFSVPIAFHHRSLPEAQLIFVPDSSALPELSGPALAHHIGQTAALPAGYTLTSATLTTDTLVGTTRGNPRLSIGGQVTNVRLPGVALTAEFAPDVAGFRRQWLDQRSEIAALAAVVLFSLVMVVESRGPLRRRPRFGLLLVTLSTFALLVLGENATIQLLIDLGAESLSRLVVAAFDLAWWITGAVLTLMAAQRLLWQPLELRSGRAVPKVIKTFLVALVFLVTVFGIVSNVLERDVTGLIATSGVLAMIIGLALQSNLSNIFSGIALNVERPIRPGDWVKIGDAPIAEVIDISWRATHVRTHVNTILNIPNSVVTNTRIENFSHPEPFFVLETWLHVDPSHDPTVVCDLLNDALHLVQPIDGRERLGLCHTGFGGVDERGGNYLIRYDCINMELFGWLAHVVLVTVDQVLRQAGIAMTTGQTEVHLNRGAPERAPAITETPVLIRASESDLDQLIHAGVKRTLAPGEVLYREGETAGSLYVLATGVIAQCRATADGGSREVARLGPGSVFGEEVLTQGSRTLSASAIGRAVLYDVSGAHLLALLEQYPALDGRLRGLLAQRTIAEPSQPADMAAPSAGTTSSFLTRMRTLFTGNTVATP